MPTGEDLIAAARRHLGVPYRIGPGVGKDPSGFDCSGLIWWAARELGVTIPHGSTAQIEHAAQIPVALARGIPGALLWREGHDGLSTGAGVIEARTPVVVEGAWSDTYDGGRTRWTHAGLIPDITYSSLGGGMSFTITSGYGPRSIVVNGKRQDYDHRGLDLRSREGAERRAIFAGRVVKVTRGRVNGAPIGRDDRNGVKAHASSISGNAVSIERANGRIYTEVHLAPTVAVGDFIAVGDLLGHTDLSGGITGAHQHVELWTKWDPSAYYDPTDEIVAALTTATFTPTPSPEEDDMFNDDDRGALKELFDALPTIRRMKEILDAVDVRTGNTDKGNLAIAARQIGQIHGRVNWATRADKSPYLISVQGDTDILLRAIAGLDTSADVDESAIARAVVGLLPAGVTLDPAKVAAAVADELADRLKG